MTLVLSVEDLRTLLADNTDLVTGLFATLSERDAGRFAGILLDLAREKGFKAIVATNGMMALALAQVDYYAADDSTASPFQHFWSLSVQGQVFLLWPLVFGAAWLVWTWPSAMSWGFFL